jgi:hypothetical protein
MPYLPPKLSSCPDDSTTKLKAADLAIPQPKAHQLTVRAELANPITRQEREQLLRSMSLIYGSNNASVEINMSKNALEIRGSYQW